MLSLVHQSLGIAKNTDSIDRPVVQTLIELENNKLFFWNVKQVDILETACRYYECHLAFNDRLHAMNVAARLVRDHRVDDLQLIIKNMVAYSLFLLQIH